MGPSVSTLSCLYKHNRPPRAAVANSLLLQAHSPPEPAARPLACSICDDTVLERCFLFLLQPLTLVYLPVLGGAFAFTRPSTHCTVLYCIVHTYSHQHQQSIHRLDVDVVPAESASVFFGPASSRRPLGSCLDSLAPCDERLVRLCHPYSSPPPWVT